MNRLRYAEPRPRPRLQAAEPRGKTQVSRAQDARNDVKPLVFTRRPCHGRVSTQSTCTAIMTEGTSPTAKAPRRSSLREDAFNLPNLLTMLRIVMIPAGLI